NGTSRGMDRGGRFGVVERDMCVDGNYRQYGRGYPSSGDPFRSRNGVQGWRHGSLDAAGDRTLRHSILNVDLAHSGGSSFFWIDTDYCDDWAAQSQDYGISENPSDCAATPIH